MTHSIVSSSSGCWMDKAKVRHLVERTAGRIQNYRNWEKARYVIKRLNLINKWRRRLAMFGYKQLAPHEVHKEQSEHPDRDFKWIDCWFSATEAILRKLLVLTNNASEMKIWVVADDLEAIASTEAYIDEEMKQPTFKDVQAMRIYIFLRDVEKAYPGGHCRAIVNGDDPYTVKIQSVEAQPGLKPFQDYSNHHPCYQAELTERDFAIIQLAKSVGIDL